MEDILSLEVWGFLRCGGSVKFCILLSTVPGVRNVLCTQSHRLLDPRSSHARIVIRIYITINIFNIETAAAIIDIYVRLYFDIGVQLPIMSSSPSASSPVAFGPLPP